MTNIRSLYGYLGIATTTKAATRGPAALGRNLVRRQAHKQLARVMRGFKL